MGNALNRLRIGNTMNTQDGYEEEDIVSHCILDATGRFLNLWNSKNRSGILPSRGDFDVFEMKEWLGRIMIMEVLGDGFDFRYRLIGTNIVQIIGRDLTGKCVTDCEYNNNLEHVLNSFRKPIAQRSPIIRRGWVKWRDNRDFIKYESVHCPLSENGIEINMTIGVQNYYFEKNNKFSIL